MPKLALKDKECFELWCGMLQIVLSHHFQKPEIINMLASSLQTKQACDFSTVRDTMYKYSKKAEDKFFAQPILAFLFIFFAISKDGQEYTKNKLGNKNGFQTEKEEKVVKKRRSKKKDDHFDTKRDSNNIRGKLSDLHQEEMNKRII